MIALTKEQLVTEREMYQLGLTRLRKQQQETQSTIHAQIGVIDFLDRKIEELAAEEAKQKAAAEAKLAETEG